MATTRQTAIWTCGKIQRHLMRFNGTMAIATTNQSLTIASPKRNASGWGQTVPPTLHSKKHQQYDASFFLT